MRIGEDSRKERKRVKKRERGIVRPRGGRDV